MASDDIADRLLAVIIDELELDPEDVTLESEFTDLGTSQELAALVEAVAEEFGVEIAEQVAESLETVQDAVEWLRRSDEGDS